MEQKKITKREVVAQMLEDEHITSNKLFFEFLTHELQILNKKATSGKLTKTQEENLVYLELIRTLLQSTEEAITIGELQKMADELKFLSNQKISALLTKLVNEKSVERIKEGKATKFKYIG